MTYPDLVEEPYGHRVAHPYRWREDADDPRTKRCSAPLLDMVCDESLRRSVALLTEQPAFLAAHPGLEP